MVFSTKLYSVFEEEDQSEISRFKINQIIFFARGSGSNNRDTDAACFAFTCSHGKTLQEAIFQCHAFRCDVPEAVGRVYQSFATSFAAPPKIMEDKLVDVSTNNNSHDVTSSSAAVTSYECSIFEVSLEFKEDDGKVNCVIHCIIVYRFSAVNCNFLNVFFFREIFIQFQGIKDILS
jgi:hypothetical protein